VLFNRSVRENIALVDPAMPMERVIAAAKLDGSINGAFSAGRRTADTSYGLA
jgi:ABC-type multidrug transport system fused ATPase/permease subunit